MGNHRGFFILAFSRGSHGKSGKGLAKVGYCRDGVHAVIFERVGDHRVGESAEWIL
jgi:hypothetical protein